MYSQIALKLYAAKKEEIIKSNARFWKEFNGVSKVEALAVDTQEYESELVDSDYSLTCAFDDDFPTVPSNIKNSDRPFLFAYKGDIKLLNDVSKNVAVVGGLTPTQSIILRERGIVGGLTGKNFNIVSGLAAGCDTVAHTECLVCGGKTIAVLPSDLDNVYPRRNVALVNEIVRGGGLVITEYISEAANKYESIKRFIERDRLQAMFASKIILIASYAQGQGDSGSRHAMQKAKEYGVERFVMYNERTDKDKPIFGLNEQLIADGATILTPKILDRF